MHDALETTFDSWWQAQARAGGGGLRVGLASWSGSTPVTMLSGEASPPTVSLSLRKSHVFADRYVPGVLEETRLIVAVRLGYRGNSDGGLEEGDAVWRAAEGDRAMSNQDLAALAVLAVRQAWHTPRSREAMPTGLQALTHWLFTKLDADDGGLLAAIRRIEPRAFAWWGDVLMRADAAAQAERAWMWQVDGERRDSPPDAAIRSLLQLIELKMSTPADRLGLCRRAQRIFDESGFRDFDLQTTLDVARCAALTDLGYWSEAVEGLAEVDRRLVANPCGGALRQTARVAWLSWRAGGLMQAIGVTGMLAGGVVKSATARDKLRRGWAIRRLRSRHPRLPQAAVIGGGGQGDVAAKNEPCGVQRVALVRLDKIGDLVTMQPVVARVREAFPHATIDLYVTQGLEDFASMLVEGVRGVGVNWKGHAAFDADLKRAAKAPKYDVLIDLLEPEVTRHARLTKAIPARFKLGFDSPARREVFTHRVPTPSGPMHLIDRTARLLRPLGVSVPDQTGWRPALALSDAAKQAGRDALREAVGDGAVLGIHVGAGWRFKQWYPESFAAVGRAMAERFGVKVAVFCGPREGEAAGRVAALIGEAASVVRPTLEALPGWCAACDLMLVNDSGPMHVAVATGTPTVVAWGPGDQTLFAPRGDAGRVAVVSDQPRCANCPQDVDALRCPMGYRYQDVPCLQQVSKEAVLAACVAMWTVAVRG